MKKLFNAKRSYLVAILMLVIVVDNVAQKPTVITKPVTNEVKVLNKDLGNALNYITPGRYIIKSSANKMAINNEMNQGLLLKTACNDNNVSCESQIWILIGLNKPSYFYIQNAKGQYLNINSQNSSVAELTTITKLNPKKTEWQIKLVEAGKFTVTTLNGNESIALAGLIGNNPKASNIKIGMETTCKGSIIDCSNQIWSFSAAPKLEKPQACFAIPLPEKPKTVPCVNCEIGVSVQPLVAATSKMWQTGSTLRVRIDGGTPLIRNKVMQYANVWTNYANIRFNFINSGDAEIIVTFGNDGQSWSMVGRDAIDDGVRFVGNFQNQGTMHFGWLTDETSDEEFSRVITHEFGHALGFKHEQGHPDSNIPWDREKAYAFYGSPPNSWDRGKVDKQVFEVFDRRETQFSNYDRTSIMQYSVSNELTIGDFEIPMNTRLSETDKAFARLMYPPGRIAGNKVVVTVVTGADDLRVNSQAFIYLKLRSSTISELKVSLNNGAGWGMNETKTIELPIPDGIAITDILECKLIFSSGKQFEWDTPDNWNVNRISVEWVTPDRFRNMLATRTGSPFIRFFNTGEATVFLR